MSLASRKPPSANPSMKKMIRPAMIALGLVGVAIAMPAKHDVSPGQMVVVAGHEGVIGTVAQVDGQVIASGLLRTAVPPSRRVAGDFAFNGG